MVDLILEACRVMGLLRGDKGNIYIHGRNHTYWLTENLDQAGPGQRATASTSKRYFVQYVPTERGSVFRWAAAQRRTQS